jgi:histidinol-phosphate aminotransferase
MALQAMAAELPNTALYPDGNGYYLKQALAASLGVGSEQITLGNGSNDVLVLLAETFLTPEHNAVYSNYCFAVYPIAVQAASAEGKVAPALPAEHQMPLGHDLEAMFELIDERTRLVFIANPNNPTGTWLDPARLADFVDSVSTDVIVVIERTFSKAYGLAGARVGYAVSSGEIADLLGRVRQPFNVNSLALAGAEAALADTQFIEASRRSNSEGMSQLTHGLSELGISFAPSAGNFILADFQSDPMPVYEALLQAGIIIRPVGNYGLHNHLRITIGTPDQNRALLAALAMIRG